MLPLSPEISRSAKTPRTDFLIRFSDGSFRKLGVPYLGVLIIRILLLGYYIRVPFYRKLPYRNPGYLLGLGCLLSLGFKVPYDKYTVLIFLRVAGSHIGP